MRAAVFFAPLRACAGARSRVATASGRAAHWAGAAMASAGSSAAAVGAASTGCAARRAAGAAGWQVTFTACGVVDDDL
jgi:hypothetical protein